MSLAIFSSAVGIGLGATLLMDIWNLFLKRGFGIPSLNYCLLGRWIRHMTSGRFAHASIARAPAKRWECAVGYLAHYSIGAAFALMFVSIAPLGWLERPSLLPAVLFGIGTVIFPFFVMQPSLGLGIASSKTPKPLQARLKSLATHTVFGVGLYLGAAALRAALGS
jgi:hypothetical protein